MESTLREEIVDKIDQILESIKVVEERCKGYSDVEDLLQTPWGMTVLDACIMRLQVIGEMIKVVDDKTNQTIFAAYLQVPWRKVIGLRNIISHEYANIDYDIIWVVIRKYLLPLKTTVQLIKKELMTE